MKNKLSLLLPLVLLGAGGLLLFARNLENVGDMIGAAMAHFAVDTLGASESLSPDLDAAARARAGWSAVSVGLVSGLSFALGWVWIPVIRRVGAWADASPETSQFHYGGVRHVRENHLPGLAYLALHVALPVWLLLPGVHQIIGRVVLPVPSHYIHNAPADFLFGLPLALAWLLMWRERVDSNTGASPSTPPRT